MFLARRDLDPPPPTVFDVFELRLATSERRTLAGRPAPRDTSSPMSRKNCVMGSHGAMPSSSLSVMTPRVSASAMSFQSPEPTLPQTDIIESVSCIARLDPGNLLSTVCSASTNNIQNETALRGDAQTVRWP